MATAQVIREGLRPFQQRLYRCLLGLDLFMLAYMLEELENY